LLLIVEGLARNAGGRVVDINFISDLENAITARSDKAGAMMHKITDLFLLNAGRYSADQLSIYDDVLKLLIEKVDTAARVKLAHHLATIDGAPSGTVTSLALNDDIQVAEPILTQSKILNDSVLVDCIATKSQKHLLAIATRRTLSETVSDRLIEKGDSAVLGAVVNNPGASISDIGFGTLVDKGVGDDWLAGCIAQRSDIPKHHLRELIAKASETVRRQLASNTPHLASAIDDILPPAPAANMRSEPAKDYRAAELVVKSQPVTEATVKDFADAKKLDEVFVSIALLSGLTAAEIERLFMDVWSSPVAVIFKAIGFHLATLQIVYSARLRDGQTAQLDLTRTRAEFIALRSQTAERILRFYRVRQSAQCGNP
jgi:Uncharacterised protein conserved in bacteria (DUF2336)